MNLKRSPSAALFTVRAKARCALLAVMGAALCAVLAPATASALGPIGHFSVSIDAETSATAEAQLKSPGPGSTYEIWLEHETTSIKEAAGTLASTDQVQVVQAQLSSLQPNSTYTAWVLVFHDGGVAQESITFTMPPPPPPGLPSGSGGKPAEFEAEKWNQEGAEREAREAPRLEEEREAKLKEEQERPIKEAEERAAHERAIREAGERAGREAAEHAAELLASQCVVPKLQGDSLKAAQRALGKAHCRLGRVGKPHGHSTASVVGAQSVRAGSRLAPGTAVAVVLRRKRR
jgi:hypothetical protein